MTIALRPEAIRVSALNGAEPAPNSVAATLEQVLYRGFMVHYHLRLPNGEPLIAFEQNGTGMNVVPGTPILAAWDEASNRVVADEGP